MKKTVYEIIEECDIEREWIYPVQNLCINFKAKEFRERETAILFKFLSEHQGVLGIPDLYEFKCKLIIESNCRNLIGHLVHFFPSLETVGLIYDYLLKSNDALIVNYLKLLINRKDLPKDVIVEASRVFKILKTKTEDYSDDLDVSIGGFSEEEDWILYGPYSDKSLLRNKLTFDLSNDIGFKASNTKFYNLFINGDLKGLYILMEKIKRDSNRVDISRNNSESIDAGYIIKIDKPTGDGESCSTCYDDSFSFRSSFDTNGNQSTDSEIYFKRIQKNFFKIVFWMHWKISLLAM